MMFQDGWTDFLNHVRNTAWIEWVAMVLITSFVASALIIQSQQKKFHKRMDMAQLYPSIPAMFPFGHSHLLWFGTVSIDTGILAAFDAFYQAAVKRNASIAGCFLLSSNKQEAVLYEPKHIKTLLRDTSVIKRPMEPWLSRVYGFVFGDKSMLMTQDQDLWKRYRHVITAELHADKLEANMQPIVDATNQAVSMIQGMVEASMVTADMKNRSLYQGACLDAEKMAEALTMDIMGTVVFGSDLGQLQKMGRKQQYASAPSDKLCISLGQALVHLFWDMRRRCGSWNPWVTSYWMPRLSNLLAWYRRKKATFVCRRLIYEAAKGLATDGSSPHTSNKQPQPSMLVRILGNLYKNQPELAQSPRLSDEIADNLISLIWSGTTPTASTVAFAVYLLAKYPDIQGKAALEARQASEVWNSVTQSLALDSVRQRLSFMYALVMETLRLFPTELYLLRSTEQDIDLGEETWVPAQMDIWIPIWHVHRNSKVWDNADNFQPERFQKFKGNERELEGRWIPFSSGLRNCPGMFLALAESVLILSSLVNHFEIRLDPHEPKEIELQAFGRNLRSKNGIPVVFIPRT